MRVARAGSPALQQVIRTLRSATGQDLDYAIVQAAEVLEQETQFRSFEKAMLHPSLWRGLPSDLGSYPQRIREHAAASLPQSLVGRRLEPDEETEITAALIRLLDGGTHVASALFALGKGTNQVVISRVAEEVRHQIGRDAWVIHQAAYSLEDMLRVPHGKRRLTHAQVWFFQEACAALAAAVTVDLPYLPASPERGYVPDPREALTQVLGVLCDRFQPRRLRRGYGHWQPGERLRLRVEQVDRLPSGDLGLGGPMYVDVNQPQLQARAVVTAPDRVPQDAVHVGLHINVGVWPPQRRVLLRGLQATAVPVGTLVRADDAEEREMVIGMNRGDLQPVSRFGNVVRDGLSESEFLLLYKAAAEIRIAEPTPDLERRARWERLQDGIAQISQRA
jgi:hypothetical protein